MFWNRKDKYEGKIGPADAMSAVSDEFSNAYMKATKDIFSIVKEFEKTTGRKVENIEIERLAAGTYNNPSKIIEQVAIKFLPRPDEVNY